MEDNSEERGRISRGRTPDRLETTGINPQAPRRGSNLLAAAGIGYENRRRLSQQNAEAHGKVFQQGNQVFIEDKQGNVTRLEVVEVHEKMGVLRKAVPTLPVLIAIVFCLLNTVLPGTGTILGALSLLCGGKCRHETASKGIKYGLIAAILQIVTAVFIVGWIYSIYYGVSMVQDALMKGAGGVTEDEQQADKNCKDVEANKNQS